MYQHIGHILLMFILLAGSAFFSGSETAFFNLSRRQKYLLAGSGYRFQQLAGKLLMSPDKLLGTLLLGNMVVNILYYALGSVLAFQIGRDIGRVPAVAVAVSSFVMLIIFGEILPKTVALANSRRISTLAALPLYLMTRVFLPILAVFRFVIINPSLRLLLGPPAKPRKITTDELRALIDASRKRGLITEEENRLLDEVIELGFLKVRDVMNPRVDIIACEVSVEPAEAATKMNRHGITRILVYEDDIDNVMGLVHLRDIILNSPKTLAELVRGTNFVPEQKSVESLLEFFRNSGTDIAVVVDEYGGIAGTVRLEDIAEELLGPIEFPAGEPIERLGPLKFRLSAGLAVRDWAEAFDLDISEAKVSTVGGLVTAMIGRIPKTGDTARLGNIKFTVEKVKQNRIQSVVIMFETVEKNGQ